VVHFDSDFELTESIKRYNPDYIVIGSDYKNKNVIGSEYCKEIIFFNKIEGYSTTKILQND
jgi:D-beta-D-heptose 7-phosphate kinase/D-beta-D-heptose 1-phosphate adenosyltransferase